MSKINSYPLTNGNTVRSVGNSVSSYLQSSQNMETQLLTSDDGTVIVQGRARGGNWKRFVGMDRAITVKLSETNNVLKAEIGAGKWLDKGVVMTVSMFVLWPLALTSGLGIYQQTKLPEKIFDYIAKTLS